MAPTLRAVWSVTLSRPLHAYLYTRPSRGLCARGESYCYTRGMTFRLASLLLLPLIFVSGAGVDIARAQTTANDPIKALEAEIASYQAQLTTLGTKKSTLESAINTLTLSQKKLSAQIKLTQNKIASTNLQIQKLSQSIGDTEDIISEHQEAIAKALRTIAQEEETPLISQVVSARSLADAWKVADEATQFSDALTDQVNQLRTARLALANNRDEVGKTRETLVTLQATLAADNKSITASKAQQQLLLTQTKNSEANYQKLLAAARAELASYSAFTTNAGGSKLLSNQTVCDDWGCYYSQRDTLWGNIPLSGANSRLAAEGCLVTAMAMMYTHYGYRSVTPATVNAERGNFSPFGGLLLFTINVNGVTATRKVATIDATLSTGNPVVVGIHAYGGTHFVVLTSGSRGAYLMRDPYIENGKDINFTTHYPVTSIFSIQKVIITT